MRLAVKNFFSNSCILLHRAFVVFLSLDIQLNSFKSYFVSSKSAKKYSIGFEPVCILKVLKALQFYNLLLFTCSFVFSANST